MKFLAEIIIEPKDGVLDPQGKASMKVVKRLGYDFVDDIKVGKHITIEMEVATQKIAEKIADELAYKIFANPILEKYKVFVRKSNETEVMKK